MTRREVMWQPTRQLGIAWRHRIGNGLHWPVNDVVSSRGTAPGWNTNDDYSNSGPQGGMRYRHEQTSASNGSANAGFFDGHAASIPDNQVPPSPPGQINISGTTRLRVLNIVNPVLPSSVVQ